ncbi:MAG: hypothetical protein CMK07_02570 [Ponticaulis sp.]|nr:hypothetical protein [Ponticaulis sp.]
MNNFRALAVAMGACALTVAGCGSSSRTQAAETDASMVGVNAFLWRATLDTIDFMPLSSADPQSGIIITDWFAPSATPEERFRMTVYILDTRLRADGVNVSVFKQVNQGGNWVDADVSADTEVQLENAILTRARELKVGDFS